MPGKQPCYYTKKETEIQLDGEFNPLTLEVLETKIAEFANRVDLDVVAHNGPPHLGLHCLPSYL